MKILHVGFGWRPLRHGGMIIYAEDLMEQQAAAGHEVAYFCAGRHYPLGARDRLRRWSRGGVQMREITSSTLIFGGNGTLTPDDDLNHPPSEAHFGAVLGELRPDVVHIHELSGLPSSLIDVARGQSVPTVATLQDYHLLCPVLKLYDVDGRLCVRQDVGEQCARCSAWAPADRRWMLDATVASELRERLPAGLGDRAVAGLRRATEAVGRARARRSAGALAAPAPLPRERSAPAKSYQARRDLNVERLGRLDALVVQSRRAAEVFAERGVDPSRVSVMQFSLRHLEEISPKQIPVPDGRVRFVTLNGCSTPQKGSEVVIGALEQLEDAGLADRFELGVFGYPPPEETRRRLERFPSVRYGGSYGHEHLDELLEDFDVGIVPSVWEESYGYVGVEFLAKGIPVIGNARGGIVEYTRDGETGWVNRDSSATGLASIMADIVRRPEQISELNAAILRRREQILKPFAEHAAEIARVYEHVVA